MKLKRITALFLLFLLAAALPSCSQGGIFDYPVVVSGVTVEAKPASVVSLSPAITNVIYELNMTDCLVGVSDFGPELEATKNLPKLGSAQAPNLAKIIELAPQVVLVSSSMSKKNITALSDKGIKTVVISSVSTLKDLAAYYNSVASVLLGNNEGKKKADNAFTNLTQRIDTLKKKIGTASKSYLLITTLAGNVATGDTLENDVLKEISLTNVATGEASWVMDQAKIAASAPDYVFYTSNLTPEQLKASPLYGSLAAVKEGRLVKVETVSFEYQSTGVFSILYQLAKAVYPDVFTPQPENTTSGGSTSTASAS